MLINQGSTARLDDTAPWNRLYEQASEKQNDLLSEVRTAVDHGMDDPVDSIEMACTAAETAGAVVRALESPWALYTPQDAATVASALFVQLQHSADAFLELRRSVGRIVERGEADLVAPAAGKPANLGDALETLQALSDTLHGLVARHASTTVRALEAAPGSALVPTDSHQTMAAVAALLAGQHDGKVALNTRHEDGDYDPQDDDSCGCGCDVTILDADEEYNFHRGDSEWSVTRASDGRDLTDGSTVFGTWETLSTSLKTAHPQQLADDVLHVIATDRQTAAEAADGRWAERARAAQRRNG
ncbi:hypothetical protein OG906_40985 (plasmid) [Streptomyces sp. NBC_01426]|uniref:hypothetical protein n=1 Tax=Streptomyces sp. NBC_01426 TaxID=2975866 RepID=UPI002E2F053A|nr:hypothetical protein [Streptomyces sp. NBC_01426]